MSHSFNRSHLGESKSRRTKSILNMNVRENLNEMASKRSGFHWLILRSSQPDRFCDCLNETSKSNSDPNPSCKKCLGSGRVFTDLFTKGLSYSPNRQFAVDESIGDPGEIRNATFHFAMEIGYRPKEQDMLAEIVLDIDTGAPITPIRFREVFNILNVRTMHGDLGREEFYSLLCEKRQIYPGNFHKEGSDY